MITLTKHAIAEKKVQLPATPPRMAVSDGRQQPHRSTIPECGATTQDQGTVDIDGGVNRTVPR